MLVMATGARELPHDVEALKALVLEERARYEQRIGELEHNLSLFAKWLWGPRSEKRPVDLPRDAVIPFLPFAGLLEDVQRLADREAAHGTLEVEPPQVARNQAKRCSSFPNDLPRVRTTIEIPEVERICCGKPMEEMGEETREELERIELSVVHVIARKKYCCRLCQERVLTAPGLPRPIPKNILGNGWLTRILVERFGNHMPYHRLEKKYAAEGLDLSRSVLCRSAIELGELFAPVWKALCKEVTESEICFGDETTVTVQESSSGSKKKAQVWQYANREGDHVFDYNESRGRDSPERMLADLEGYLHDDGYIVYETALDPDAVKHVACLAHVRRKFVDAEKTDPKLAAQVLFWIRELYALDRRAKDRKLTIEDVRQEREEFGIPILECFKDWLEVARTQVLPESPMGAAIKYTLGRWEAIVRILEDGRLELDNNRSERALRPVAVGRKNWIVIGNERGGRTASVFYSLVTTCKARGIDPYTYLHDAMLRLVEGYDPEDLTPRRWEGLFARGVADRRDFVLATILEKLGA